MKLLVNIVFIVLVLSGVNLAGDDPAISPPTNTEAQQSQGSQEFLLSEVDTRLQELEARLKVMQSLLDEITQEAQSRPSRIFRSLIPRLSEIQNDVTQGFIGVQMDQATDSGVPIVRVFEGSPASVAGIEVGDVILKVHDSEISKLDDPIASTVELINSNPPGTTIQITLLRANNEITLDVTTARRSSIDFENTFSIEIDSVLQNLTDRFETILRESREIRKTIYIMEIEETFGRYFGVENGVLVIAAKEGGEIQPGDVLLKIDDQPIQTTSQATSLMQAADDEFTILVKRDNREERITLRKDQLRLRPLMDRGS